MSTTLTRKEMAEGLGVPESRLHYTPQAPRLNRRQRRKIERLIRRATKGSRDSPRAR